MPCQLPTFSGASAEGRGRATRTEKGLLCYYVHWFGIATTATTTTTTTAATTTNSNNNNDNDDNDNSNENNNNKYNPNHNDHINELIIIC